MKFTPGENFAVRQRAHRANDRIGTGTDIKGEIDGAIVLLEANEPVRAAANKVPGDEQFPIRLPGQSINRPIDELVGVESRSKGTVLIQAREEPAGQSRNSLKSAADDNFATLLNQTAINRCVSPKRRIKGLIDLSVR